MVLSNSDWIDEDEPLDPRIQNELEKLNTSAVVINKLENELDAAYAKLHEEHRESNDKLNRLATKLGSSIGRSKKYYDLRLDCQEKQEAMQLAAHKCDKAASVLSTAREIVDVAESACISRQLKLDESWQEMLNAAIYKVTEAEHDLVVCQAAQDKCTMAYTEAHLEVKRTHKLNRKYINKSKVYYELMAKYNGQLEAQQDVIKKIKIDIGEAKKLYSQALSSLETISDEIHCKRVGKSGADCEQDSLDGGGKVLASESLTESEGYFTDQGSSDEATEAQADAGAEEDEVLVLRLPSAAQLQSDLSDSDQSISSSASEPVMRGGVQVRERSKSCAVEQTPVADEQSFERSVSLPDVIEKKTPNFLAQGDSSSSIASVLDDQCVRDAMSFRHFDTVNNLSEVQQFGLPPTSPVNRSRVGKYGTLPNRLSQYQRQFTLARQSTIDKLSEKYLTVTDLYQIMGSSHESVESISV